MLAVSFGLVSVTLSTEQSLFSRLPQFVGKGLHVMFGISSVARMQTQSLKLITANIMISDVDLNIRYMNESVMELLKEAESDLKKELPASILTNSLAAISIFFIKTHPISAICWLLSKRSTGRRSGLVTARSISSSRRCGKVENHWLCCRMGQCQGAIAEPGLPGADDGDQPFSRHYRVYHGR